MIGMKCCDLNDFLLSILIYSYIQNFWFMIIYHPGEEKIKTFCKMCCG